MPDSYGQQLADWGKVVMLMTTGRVSGRAIRTAVGFVVEPDDTSSSPPATRAPTGPRISWPSRRATARSAR